MATNNLYKMPHHRQSKADTYVTNYGYMPFNESFYGNNHSLKLSGESTVYAKPIFFKSKGIKGLLKIFTSEDVYLLFGIFLSVGSEI